MNQESAETVPKKRAPAARQLGTSGTDHPDGSLTTKGDANELNDSTPVPADSLRGVVKMVAPLAGYPSMLLGTGRYMELSLMMTVLLVAGFIVHVPEPRFLEERPSPRRSTGKAKAKTAVPKPRPGVVRTHHSRA